MPAPLPRPIPNKQLLFSLSESPPWIRPSNFVLATSGFLPALVLFQFSRKTSRNRVLVRFISSDDSWNALACVNFRFLS